MLRFHTGGIAQYLSDASKFAASFMVMQFITQLTKKNSERRDIAGDRCMAITVIQYFIVFER